MKFRHLPVLSNTDITHNFEQLQSSITDLERTSARISAEGKGTSSSSSTGIGTELLPQSPRDTAANTAALEIAISPDGKYLYCSNEGTEKVSQFERSLTTGKLTPLSPAEVETGGTGPWGMAISPDGKFLYVALFVAEKVTVFERNTENGKLTKLETKAVGKEAMGLVITPNGKYVYVTDFGAEKLHQFEVEEGTGKLVALTPATVATKKEPRHLAVSPDGKSLYVPNAGSANVSQFEIPTNGKLAPLAPAEVATSETPYFVLVSRDNKNVYVSCYKANNANQFSRDTATGKITALSPSTTTMLGLGTSMAVESPTEDVVYFAMEVSSYVRWMLRERQTGPLWAQYTENTANVGTQPQGIAMSPDGKFIYTANVISNNISILSKSLI